MPSTICCVENRCPKTMPSESMARNNITAVRSRMPLRSIGFKLPQYSKRAHPIMKSPAILNTYRKSWPLPRKKLGWIGISTKPRLIRNHSIAINPSAMAPTRKAVFNMTTFLFEIFSFILALNISISHNAANHRRQKAGRRRSGSGTALTWLA